MALLKAPISIDDPDFLDKCNSKLCYVCGDLVSTYEKFTCACGGVENRPEAEESICVLCRDGKPSNVPICDKEECIEKLSDKPPAKIVPEDT